VYYEQAAAGTLPALSWLMPQQDACDHPCHDMAKGERILKDFYEVRVLLSLAFLLACLLVSFE